MTVSERVGVSCLSAVLGSVLPRSARWPSPPVSKQTRRNMLRARPSLQAPLPRSKAAGHNASRWPCRLAQRTGTLSGCQATKKKFQKSPLTPSLACARQKTATAVFGSNAFSFIFLCDGVLCDTSMSCHLLSLLWRAGVLCVSE